MNEIIGSERRDLPVDFLAQSRPVALVCAPAGYGKTTLLRKWQTDLRLQDASVVSVVVDSDDRDGDRLAVSLLQAFTPADAQRSLMFSGGLGEHGRRTLLTALLAELSAIYKPVALFIDDLHLITEPLALSTLRLLIAHQPERLALVLGSRSSELPFMTEALLDGRVTRFDASALAFDVNDIGRLLVQHGIEPRSSRVEYILQKTNGWPAAARMIAMSLSGASTGKQNAALENLLTSQQPLTGYLADLLLSQMPPRTARFLQRLSLLRRFNVEVAAAVTEDPDAGALLAQLEQQGLPVTPSGDTELRSSLHPLVRDFLLARIRRDDLDAVARSTTLAVDWLVSRERIDAAIDVSLDVGDVGRAAQLIDCFAQNAARAYGRHADFLYWCNKLRPSEVGAYPKIQLMRVWSLSVLRRYPEAERILEEVRTQLSAAADAGQDLKMLVELETCLHLALKDEWMSLPTLVDAFTARWPTQSPIHRGAVHLMKGCGLMASSRLEDALIELDCAYQLVTESQAFYSAAWAGMFTVTALTKLGRYRQALIRNSEVIAYIVAHLGGQTPVEVMLQAQRSFLLYEFDRLDEAGAALEHGLTAMVEQSSIDGLIMGTIALARLQAARQRPLDALESLAEAAAKGWSAGLPRVAVAAAAERIELLLKLEEVEQGEALWQDLQRAVEQDSNERSARPLEDKRARIEARLAMARGANKSALKKLEGELSRVKACGQKRKLVEIMLLQALALFATRDFEQSWPTLRRALGIAMAEGYVRVFVDEGSAMRSLFVSYLNGPGAAERKAARGEFIDKLSEAMGIAGPSSNASRRPDLPEGLTRKEVKVLEKLSSGLSYTEMADALLISQGTFKWHLKNIYSKLAVNNRMSAVLAGKERGYLPSSG